MVCRPFKDELMADNPQTAMDLCCAYCEHKYTHEVKSDLHKEVMQHVREKHPDKWAMVRPKDEWTKQDGG
jgi:hypothetical protein